MNHEMTFLKVLMQVLGELGASDRQSRKVSKAYLTFVDEDRRRTRADAFWEAVVIMRGKDAVDSSPAVGTARDGLHEESISRLSGPDAG